MRKKIFEKPEIGAMVIVDQFSKSGIAYYELRITPRDTDDTIEFYFINPLALHNFLDRFNRKHTWQYWTRLKLPLYYFTNVRDFADSLGKRTRLLQYEFDVTHTN